jgi:histidine triad (HIT) family protein
VNTENSGDSIFARIARKEVNVPAIYEDDFVIAFADIAPQAPVHVVIIPKRPFVSVADLTVGDVETAGRLLLAAAEVARRTSIDRSGYRVVFNSGSDGGQSVPYLHAHVLGGRPMTWPPG